MSHRTQSLPTLSGFPIAIRSLRYHEFSRQSIGPLLAAWLAVVTRPVPWLVYSVAPILLLGAGVRIWAPGIIIKKRALATKGPYAFVPHPRHVGNILILIAFSVASGSWGNILVVAAFIAF